MYLAQRSYQRCNGEEVSCPYACCSGSACVSCGCDDGDSAYTGSLCSSLSSAQTPQAFCSALRDTYRSIPQCTQRIISQIYSGLGCGVCYLSLRMLIPLAPCICSCLPEMLQLGTGGMHADTTAHASAVLWADSCIRCGK